MRPVDPIIDRASLAALGVAPPPAPANGVDPALAVALREAFAGHFDACLADGSPPKRTRCTDCGEDSPAGFLNACPFCGSPDAPSASPPAPSPEAA